MRLMVNLQRHAKVFRDLRDILLRCTKTYFIYRITQKISDTLWTMLRLEMYFEWCSMFFNTFQQSWKNFMDSVYPFAYLSVRPIVHALSLISSLQISWHLYMLFIFDAKWTILKMICMELKVYLQRRTKVFWCITAYGKKMLKRIWKYLCSVKYNKNNLCHSEKCHTQKHVLNDNA